MTYPAPDKIPHDPWFEQPWQYQEYYVESAPVVVEKTPHETMYQIAKASVPMGGSEQHIITDEYAPCDVEYDTMNDPFGGY